MAKSMVSGVKNNVGSLIWDLLIHLFFLLIVVCCVVPILIVISTSLSNEMSIVRDGFGLLPRGLSFDAYKAILFKPLVITRAYGVTIIVTLCGTIGALWLVSTLAYVMSRKDFVLRKQYSFFVFFTMLFNGGLVPFYILVAIWLGMKDSLLSLIVPYLVSAWYVLLMKGFFSGIPDSIIECSKIDGASEFRIFTSIIIPISKPALATVGLFLVLQYWNDWWLPMLFIYNEKLFTLQFLLARVLTDMEFLSRNLDKLAAATGGRVINTPTLTARFAMCILAAGPMLFVFMFFQKYFVSGIVVGSVKG